MAITNNLPQGNLGSTKSDLEPRQSLLFLLATTRFQLWIALFLFLGSFLFYTTTTLVPFAVPGEPSNLLASATGITPNLHPRNYVWRLLMQGVFSVAPTASFTLWCNVLNTFFSSLAIALTFLVLAHFLLVVIDRKLLHKTVSVVVGEERVLGYLKWVPVISGLAGAFALLFSAPFWFASTQPYPYGFYLCWLLLSFYFLLQYALCRRLSNLYVFFVLFGAGMGQVPSFVGFAPLVLLYALFLLWSDDRLSVRSFFLSVLLVVGPMLLLLSCEIASYYHSEGYRILTDGHPNLFNLIKTEVLGLVVGVIGSIPRAWWLILLSLTVLPFLAVLMVAARALNAHETGAIVALHIVVAITSILVLLDLSFSPWQFYNVESLQILPYCMVALTFGYIIAWVQMIIIDFCLSAPVSFRLRTAVVFIAALFLGYTAYHNSDDARVSGQRFVRDYVDLLLENLEGRDWLVTATPLDENILIRAHERGMDINIINLSKGNAKQSTVSFREKLPSVRLQNMLDVGMIPLIREWISARDDADERLALTVLPDLWHLAKLDILPNGFSFLGIPEGKAKEIAEEQPIDEKVLKMLDDLDEAFREIPEDAYARILFNQKIIRRAASFIANNTGFLLQQVNRREEAFRVFDRTVAFDPDNVSAMLNWANIVHQDGHTNRVEAVNRVLADFQQKGTTPPNIWSLSSSFGYVTNPQAFMSLGWTWAQSGNSELALHSLKYAEKSADPVNRNRIRSMMAEVYLQSGDTVASEGNYLQVLESDPVNPNALLGIAHVCIQDGRFQEARNYLLRASGAGVPEDRILFESAALDLIAGNLDSARVQTERLREIDRENASVYVLLSLIHSQRYEIASQAGNQEERKLALADMVKVSDELIRIKGEKDFQALFTRGRTRVLSGRYAEAREDFAKAIMNAKGVDVLPVMDMLLRMDYALSDKISAVRHAREIVSRKPDHSFANYILGSLQLEEERFASAEDFLERSLIHQPNSIFSLNDLACAKLALHKNEEAEVLVRKALSLDDSQATIWDTLGCVLMAREDYAGAREALEEAVSLDKENPYIHLHYAQALMRVSEYKLAAEIVRRIGVVSDNFSSANKRALREIMKELADRNIQ